MIMERVNSLALIVEIGLGKKDIKGILNNVTYLMIKIP